MMGECEDDFVAVRVLGETARHVAIGPAAPPPPPPVPADDSEAPEEIDEPAWTWLPKRAVCFTGDGEIALPEGLAKRAGLIR